MSRHNESPIDTGKEEFRETGYMLIDYIADFFDKIDEKPVTTGESPEELRKILGNSSMPEEPAGLKELISRAAGLMLNHSLLNGHPKFLGYITSSPSPVGALADLLAAAVNPNVGANILSPMATEIEKQAIKWLAGFIGLPPTYGGIFVSGGNMANFTAFLAARTAKAPKSIKEKGISIDSQKFTVYCSDATHIWIEKAAVLFGLGLNSVRWIQSKANRIDLNLLEYTLMTDIKNGCKPLMIVGTAGDVSTGAVDDLEGIASICKKYDLWFHIDGAYGIPAIIIPELKPLFNGMEKADSIAIDPHKWLYSPLEAGCTLVKDPNKLKETFSSHPSYYNFRSSEEDQIINFYEYGLQNSRGFRALKVWLALQQAGLSGYRKLINKDISLARLLSDKVADHPELELISQNLSITVFRYAPAGLADAKDREARLNNLNESLLNDLQQGGEVFLSNAIVNGKYCLRACFVNFRTSEKDIEEIVQIIVKEGKKVHTKMVTLWDSGAGPSKI